MLTMMEMVELERIVLAIVVIHVLGEQTLARIPMAVASSLIVVLRFSRQDRLTSFGRLWVFEQRSSDALRPVKQPNVDA